MERITTIRHQIITLESTFEDFTSRFEILAGHFEESVLDKVDSDPKEAEADMKAMQGEGNFMLFQTLDHGQVLKLMDMQKKIIQYNIGNPLIAATMTQLDPRAGLHAPFRILVTQ